MSKRGIVTRGQAFGPGSAWMRRRRNKTKPPNRGGYLLRNFIDLGMYSVPPQKGAAYETTNAQVWASWFWPGAMSLSVGNYKLNGEQNTLKKTSISNAQSGSYALTGEQEKLLKTSLLNAQPAFFFVNTKYQAFLTPGAGTFIVPAGVTSLQIEAWGSGGGGSGANTDNAYGGSGGGYSGATVTVTPGQTVYYNVGTHGSGANAVGTSGTDSWINPASNAPPSSNGVIGGAGQAGDVDNNPPSGGVGSIGTVNFNGGASGPTTGLNDNFGSGGGGGAGSGGNGGDGGDGTVGTGGTAGSPDGGAGADGTPNGGGSAGTQPGGGGGGAWFTGNGSDGADGRVQFTWGAIVGNEKLKKGNLLLAQMTPYAFTGESLTLTIPITGFSMSIGTGTYSLTDETLTLLKTSSAGLQAGVYSLTDEQLKILKTSALKGSSGTYTLTDETLTLKAGRLAKSQSGLYTQADENLGLLKASVTKAQTGLYSLTGESLSFKAARLLLAQMTPFALTDESLTLTFTTFGAFTMSIGTGAYSLSDESLTLLKASKQGLQVGVYGLTDEALSALKGSRLVNTSGTYMLTGGALTLTQSAVGPGFVIKDNTPRLFAIYDPDPDILGEA